MHMSYTMNRILHSTLDSCIFLVQCCAGAWFDRNESRELHPTAFSRIVAKAMLCDLSAVVSGAIVTVAAMDV